MPQQHIRPKRRHQRKQKPELKNLYETRNERGNMLVDYMEINKLYSMNYFFQKKSQRKQTWISPDRATKNKTDNILTKEKGIVKDVTVLNPISIGSDPRLVRTNVKIKTNQIIKNSNQIIRKSIGTENLKKIEQYINHLRHSST